MGDIRFERHFGHAETDFGHHTNRLALNSGVCFMGNIGPLAAGDRVPRRIIGPRPHTIIHQPIPNIRDISIIGAVAGYIICICRCTILHHLISAIICMNRIFLRIISPELPAIRALTHQQAKITTALIREPLRSQFGNEHEVDFCAR